MRILSNDEMTGWLAGESFCSEDWDRSLQVEARYYIPPDSGRKTAICREVSAIVRPPVMLWINEWGIWPSSENMGLFDLLRHAVAEARPIWEASGHLFEEDENELLSSFLSVTLYFIWGAMLVEPALKRVWTISHDEWIGVKSESVDPIKEATDLFDRMGWERAYLFGNERA